MVYISFLVCADYVNVFTDQTILARSKLKNFYDYSCNSPTLNFMKFLYKPRHYTWLQTRFRFLAHNS